jgi:hypothetical protein
MISLRDLPATLRVLFSSFLIVIGIGYLSALSYLFLVESSHIERRDKGWWRVSAQNIMDRLAALGWRLP